MALVPIDGEPAVSIVVSMVVVPSYRVVLVTIVLVAAAVAAAIVVVVGVFVASAATIIIVAGAATVVGVAVLVVVSVEFAVAMAMAAWDTVPAEQWSSRGSSGAEWDAQLAAAAAHVASTVDHAVGSAASQRAPEPDVHSSLAGWRRLEAMAAERKRVAAARDNP